MRILQIGKYYHPEKGGIETVLRCLSAGLHKTVGVEVVVAAKGRHSAVDQVDGISIERLGSLVHVAGAPICPKLISRLRRASTDIVHIHLPNPWAAIAYLLSNCKIPLIVTYHSDIVRQSHIEPVLRPILFRFLRRAGAIICATQDVINNSRTLAPFLDKCVVIPFGIDLTQIEKVEGDKIAAITKDHKRPIVLAVGRLVSYKGFEFLIRAMAAVNASLIIVGKGPLKADLLQIAATFGVASKVTILDHVDDVGPYYHAADIFVLPSISRNEAFGIVQIEAMAAGKPVINTQLASGVPWVSINGVTGITVAPSNSNELANALNQLIHDTELRLKYGSAARGRALAEFGLNSMISRTVALYGRFSKQNVVPPKLLRYEATLAD